MRELCNRREWMGRIALGMGAAPAGLGVGERPGSAGAAEGDGERLARVTWDFILRCRREDGGYAPSPDPQYGGESDTKLSDLAAVTYAAVLARTMGRELPQPGRSVAFLRRHQRPDGRFVNLAGQHDPESDLGVLYNTTQGVVALRALGDRPEVDPTPVVERLLAGDTYQKLPWYTTSFFPLFYAALGRPFPQEARRKLARHMERHQAEDGYLGDHVAATFHMAHFYRLIGQPTPRADRMIARVLRDQKPEGGWDIKEPDWDVHACFDAVFILRQLGGDDPKVRGAIARGAGWALRCRNADRGFGHFPGRPSDMDAVYFQLGALIMAGRVPGARLDRPDAHTLGWGHAMWPGRDYKNIPLDRP
jgi:Prenyltransferase and squalene oxidase repeat